MIVGIFFVTSRLLFVGFLLLTRHEAEVGRRMFAASRASFDEKTSFLFAAFKHIDASALIVHGIRDVLKKVVHDIAHLLLATVEALQKFLRRTVVRLKESTPLHRGNPRAFIEHMKSAKKDRREEDRVE